MNPEPVSTPGARYLDQLLRAEHAADERAHHARGNSVRAEATGHRLDAAGWRRVANAHGEHARTLRALRSTYLADVHGLVGDPTRPTAPPRATRRARPVRDPLHPGHTEDGS